MVWFGRFQSGLLVVQEQCARVAVQEPNGPVLQILQCHCVIIVHVHGHYTTAVNT